MFACEKVAFPFAVVSMFDVVLSGRLFWQCLTSWRLRWFLKLLGKPNNFSNHYGIFKSNYQPCHQEDNPNVCPKSVLQSLVRAFPSFLNLADSHTLHKLPLAFLSLSPKPSTWLSVCCLPAATHTVCHSKDKRVLSTQQLTKKKSNSPMCLFAEEHSINSINGDKKDLIVTYNNSVVLKPH